MKKKKKIKLLLLVISGVILFFLVFSLIKSGKIVPVTHEEPGEESKVEMKNLYKHVDELAVKIGPRSLYQYGKLKEAEDYIKNTLKEFGLEYTLQTYDFGGKSFNNVIVTLPGEKEPGKVVVIGAHYDTVPTTPGADDNASAAAVLLEICRNLKDYRPAKTLKLIFFVNEEPPAFNTKHMGSYVYAKRAKQEKEDIVGMICLEMVGYYSDIKGGQTFPLPLMNLIYPDTPNFIAIVGNFKSRKLVKHMARSIKKASTIPVETLSTFEFVPGVNLSDHASFWKMGYPAVMVTDTSFYRNPNYHTPDDTINTLDFEKMAKLLKGLISAAKDRVE